ncbi:Trk system potassium transporter TrkA [Fusobacterium sp. PH5-44]|uniref:Trk system potassium transporter TrkA n=1 Tax=unclassified Fusobacterium TaxID=2648384 RepID=UPI003D22EA25
MKIIIVGCGKVGTNLIKELSQEEHDIAIIDKDGELVEELSTKYDALGIVGNGASYSVLMEAGIEKADFIIAVTDSDELNLLCCLFAKKAGKCETIARVRNPVYNKEIKYIKDELRLSMIINPEYAAATEIARILRMPSAIEINTFAKGRVELLKFKIAPESIIHGMSLIDVSVKLKCDVLICAVERDDEVFIPSGQFVLRGNDIVSIVASPKNASIFFKKIGVVTNQAKNAMIIGGGKITYYLGEQLSTIGIDMKIFETNIKKCEELSELIPKAVVIHGDGTNYELLNEEGLENADAFITLTGFDEGNIMLSLFAKYRSKAKIITKINKKTFNEVVENLDLGTIIQPEYITAEYIINYIRGRQNSIGSNVESLYKIIEDRAEALEFSIKEDSEIVGIPLMELQLKENLLVACINRNGKIIIPRGQDKILKGDTVIVVTTNLGLDNVKNILK